MHARRTLDMYGYPSLRNTDERDGDQVLYKYTKSIQEASPEQQTVEKYRARLSRRTQKPKDEPESLPLAVLMVDTLWLWILADDTILTFAPRRESSSDSKSFNTYQADPVINVLQALTVERRAEVNDCFDLAALIVFYCVESLLKGSVDSNLKVFRIFEGFTSDKVEEQTASYKAFRKAQKSERREFDNGDDLNNLLELRDISDELNVILVLLTQQRDQVQNIIDIYEKKINTQSRGGLGTDLLKATKTRLKDYISLTEKLIESSTKAQDSYDKLLSLKEAHSGVLEARTASEQARIVNIFTVVTIVFSPLSFFSGIFGMVSHCSCSLSTLRSFHFLYTSITYFIHSQVPTRVILLYDMSVNANVALERLRLVRHRNEPRIVLRPENHVKHLTVPHSNAAPSRIQHPDAEIVHPLVTEASGLMVNRQTLLACPQRCQGARKKYERRRRRIS